MLDNFNFRVFYICVVKLFVEIFKVCIVLCYILEVMFMKVFKDLF